MSDEERALLRGICAAPSDDTPRLVYADWLDEHGRGDRAALIRVQCEMAKLPSRLLSLGRDLVEAEARRLAEKTPEQLTEAERTTLSAASLWRRHRELFPSAPARGPCGLTPQEEAGWNVPDADEAALEVREVAGGDIAVKYRFVWRRGFVSSVTAPTLASWADLANRILPVCPVATVRLKECPRVTRASSPEASFMETVAFADLPQPRPVVTLIDPSNRECINRLLQAEWPGLHFELPPEPGAIDAGTLAGTWGRMLRRHRR